MCGIAGFYGFEDKKLLKQFSKDMVHRGPDGEGTFVNEQVSLLSRRLAIIDLKTGGQPIFNEDETVLTVSNGEIYNYKQLRKELEALGHRFKTLSDTEVIVHAYEQWGESCFDKFNGMFGTAIYDIKQDKLVLARDHFGIKPLYFTILPNKNLVFASEIKPLLNSKLISTRPNEKVLYRYLRYRVHDDSPETFFENIYRLMPGQYLSINGSSITNGYFSKLEEELKQSSNFKVSRRAVGIRDSEVSGQISNKAQIPNRKEQTAKFKEQLIEAIKLRLIADVPVGTCLSGGLDSSTVVTVVNKLLSNKTEEARSVGTVQNSFSAVFPGSSNDEEKYIDELVKVLKKDGGKIKSFKVLPKVEDFFSEIEDFVRTQEEPTISTGPYAQFAVMREAKKHVKVLLDGQGADEMMAGYLPYYFVYLKQLKKEGKWLLLLVEMISSSDVISKYVILKLKSLLSRINTEKYLGKQFIKRHKGDEKFETISDNLKLRLVKDIFYDSLPSLLRYEDKNSMRFSIEGRVPFLDTNLVKFIFSLPDEAIIKMGWNKNILRESTKDLLPNLIRKRRNKIGFTTPEEEWFMRMKNKIYSIFLSPSFASRSYFNQPQVLRSFQKFIEGKNTDTLLFWRLLNVELWLREFFPDDEGSIKSVMPPTSPRLRGARGKPTDIKVGEKTFSRHLIRTDVFQKDDDFVSKISNYAYDSLSSSSRVGARDKLQRGSRSEFFLVVSEKIIAISQGRSYFIWDIKAGIWAKILSKHVTKTPNGIGLGSQWTMQLAIQEIGLPKVLLASLAAAVTKPLGIKGVFYNIVGEAGRAIDGPTEYSLYPSNVSAKLAPKNPKQAAQDIEEKLRENLKLSDEKWFQGVVIIDANDIGRNILANTTAVSDETVKEIFRDNPMGQGTEQTPITIVSIN